MREKKKDFNLVRKSNFSLRSNSSARNVNWKTFSPFMMKVRLKNTKSKFKISLRSSSMMQIPLRVNMSWNIINCCAEVMLLVGVIKNIHKHSWLSQHAKSGSSNNVGMWHLSFYFHVQDAQFIWHVFPDPYTTWNENNLKLLSHFSCSVNWETQTFNATSYIVFLFVFGLVVPVNVIVYSYVKIILTMRDTAARSGRVNKVEGRVTSMIFVMIIGESWSACGDDNYSNYLFIFLQQHFSSHGRLTAFLH